MKKRIRGWCLLVLGSFALFAGVFSSIFLLGGSAAADSLTSYEKARANLSVRILAKDLSICHGNLQDTISVTKSAGTKFNSTTYWKKPNGWVALPTIFDNNENKTKPSCYELITGWQKQNNFFNKLLTVLSAGGYATIVDWSAKSDYPGVDTTVALPGVDNNNTSAESNVEQMKQFLEGSKFQKTSTGVSAQLNGYRCIYFEMSANSSVWDNISYPAPPTSMLMSLESFCVGVDGNGNVDTSKNPIVIGEYDNKGNAVIRERAEGTSYISLMPTGDSEFKWDTRAALTKHFLGIHIEYLKGWWDEASSGNYNNIEIKNYNNKDSFVSQCYNSIVQGSNYRCELTDEADKKKNIPTISFDTFKSRLTQYVASLHARENMMSDNAYKLFVNVVAKELDTDSYSYTKGSVEDFIKYFFNQNGDKIIDNGKYTMRTEEKYMFYYDHLKNYFNVSIVDEKPDSSSSEYIEVYWLDEAKDGFVKKYINSFSTSKACALDGGTWDPGCNAKDSGKDWKYFATMLGGFKLDELTTAFNNVELLDEDYVDQHEDQLIDGGTDPNCMNSATTGPTAWILCPTAELLTNATTGIYEGVIEPLLEVNSYAMFTSSNNAVLQAWGYFRDFANVVFVILFMIVIFSQITGVGIDNYGIKKILPKLIVTAILINLSYLICVLAIDTSNIIGNSVKSLLDGLSDNITDFTTVPVDAFSSGHSSGVAIAQGGTAIIGIAIIVVIAGIFIEGAINDPSTLIPLLIALLGAVIGVIFFFILLAFRQAAIICLTVVSPVIVVLYALPNTKKYFDKVTHVFWKMLVFYPVCGLLIGGGNFASKLLLASHGDDMSFFELLVAAAVSIAPIFFIPELLTATLNGLGGLGSKIQGLGNKLRSGATRTMNNSDAVQRARKAGAEHKARMDENRRYFGKALSTGQYRDKDGNLRQMKGPMSAISKARRGIAGTGMGRMLGWDAQMGKDEEEFAQKSAERYKNQQTFRNSAAVGAMMMDEAKSSENTRLGKADAGIAVVSREAAEAEQKERNVRTRAANNNILETTSQRVADAEAKEKNNRIIGANKAYDRMFAEKGEAGIVKGDRAFEAEKYNELGKGTFAVNDNEPHEIDIDHESARQRNTIRQQNADEAQPVPELTIEVAESRAKANVSAIERKNADEEFKNTNMSEIAQSVGELVTTETVVDQSGASIQVQRLNDNNPATVQRFISGIQASIQKGGEKQVYAQLENFVSDDPLVYDALTTSPDPTVASWAKEMVKDGTVKVGFGEYLKNQFASKVNDKGASLMVSMNDKGLQELYDMGGYTDIKSDIMINSVLQKTKPEEIKIMNKMIENGTNTITLSGKQLIGLETDTITAISNRKDGGAGMEALKAAYEAVKKDPTSLASLSEEKRNKLDALFPPTPPTPQPGPTVDRFGTGA